jgi:hypothetical protein
MKRYIIILPAELQQEANEYCSQFTSGGEYTFTIKLSTDGLEPVTHYISNWFMTQAEEFLIKQRYEQYMNEVQNSDDTLLLQKLNLQKIIKKPCVDC